MKKLLKKFLVTSLFFLGLNSLFAQNSNGSIEIQFTDDVLNSVVLTGKLDFETDDGVTCRFQLHKNQPNGYAFNKDIQTQNVLLVAHITAEKAYGEFTISESKKINLKNIVCFWDVSKKNEYKVMLESLGKIGVYIKDDLN